MEQNAFSNSINFSVTMCATIHTESEWVRATYLPQRRDSLNHSTYLIVDFCFYSVIAEWTSTRNYYFRQLSCTVGRLWRFLLITSHGLAYFGIKEAKVAHYLVGRCALQRHARASRGLSKISTRNQFYKNILRGSLVLPSPRLSSVRSYRK